MRNPPDPHSLVEVNHKIHVGVIYSSPLLNLAAWLWYDFAARVCLGGLEQNSCEVAHPPSAEFAAALAGRVCASPEFQRSPRSQELLRYLCRSASDGPAGHITEHEIGVTIFGWDRDRHPETDTIVRVQVSQLRKRLEHYFLTVGRDEKAVILIPRGTYTPLIQWREPTLEGTHTIEEPSGPEGTAKGLPTVPASPASVRRLHLKTAAASAAITAALLIGVFYLLPREHTAARDEPRTPALDRFWSGFRNGVPAVVVLPDANERLLTEFFGYTIPLAQYTSDGYPRNLIEKLPTERERYLARRTSETQMTGMQDANALALLTTLLTHYRVPVTSILARDFRLPHPGNLILLGHLKGNPWLELFESKLNFVYKFDWPTRNGSVINREPLRGEESAYSVTYDQQGYCVVASMPNVIGEGEAILIYGTDVASLEAGARFACDEEAMGRLNARLGAPIGKAPRHVQVLLKTKLFHNLAPEYTIIAHRVAAR